MTEEEQTDHEINILMRHAQTNKFVAERLSRLTEKAIADAKALYGSTIATIDALRISELRLASLGNGEMDPEAYSNQMAALEVVVSQRRKAQLQAGLNVEAADLSDVLLIKDRAHRLSESRRLGIASPKPENESKGLSHAEKIQILLTLPPSVRIAKAREWGLA